MNKQLAEFIRTFALVFLDISLAFGQQLGDPAAGKRVADTSCLSCHGSQTVTQKAPSFSDIAGMKSTTAQSLGVFLRTSHSSMPNLVLTPMERDDVIAYILSLR